MPPDPSPWPPELRAFLTRFGVVEGATLGPWTLARAALGGRVVELTFAQGEHVVVTRIAERDASKPCFGTTESFNLSYGRVGSELEPLVKPLMFSLAEIVRAHDPGGLRVPLPAQRDAGTADFGFADVHVDDLARYPDAMYEMFGRRMDVMIVRGVFSAAQAAAIVARLEAPGGGYRWKPNVQTDSTDHEQPYNLGEVLIPTRRCPDGPELATYFDEAAEFRRVAADLFAGGLPFEGRVEEVLARVAGGRRVSIPRGPAGEHYTPATVRAIPTGGELALHVGNYFKDHGAYRHLRTFVDLDDQLSYFVTLQPPDEGGEIEVYSLEWASTDRPLRGGGEIDAEAVARDWPSVKYRPGAGDMFLFDGGRYYHRVCPTRGPRTRWTIGGFVTISRDHDEYFYWS